MSVTEPVVPLLDDELDDMDAEDEDDDEDEGFSAAEPVEPDAAESADEPPPHDASTITRPNETKAALAAACTWPIHSLPSRY